MRIIYFIITIFEQNIQQLIIFYFLENYLVPKGSVAHVHVYDLHRDAAFWPEPNKFDPDRFIPEKIRDRHPYSFIPFSAGPRNCIGNNITKKIKLNVIYSFINFE